MRRLLALAFGVTVFLWPSTARALPITYMFSGVFGVVNAPFGGVLSVGDPWSLSISADPTAIVGSGPGSTSYSAGGSWTLGSFSGTVTGGFITVLSVPGVFGFSSFSPFPGSAIWSPPAIGGAVINSMAISLAGSPFSSTALPTSLANVSVGSFSLNHISFPGNPTSGFVNSITVTTMPPPIPEPTSALLLGTGLVAIGVRRFRHKR